MFSLLYVRFMHGVTDELLEEHRKRLMGVTVDDLLRVADMYLPLPAGRCVLGPHNEEITKHGKSTWTLVEA